MSRSGYSWGKPDALHQNVWISVTSWNYKVFPYLSGDRFGTYLIQFEGTTTVGENEKVYAGGDTEVVEPSETIGMLEEHWGNSEDFLEGYGFISNSDELGQKPPESGFTLYCKELALDWVLRAFSVGLSSAHGAISIQLAITYPPQSSNEFWADEWLSKWWKVQYWKLFTGAARS